MNTKNFLYSRDDSKEEVGKKNIGKFIRIS